MSKQGPQFQLSTPDGVERVFDRNSNLVFQGNTEDAIKWLQKNPNTGDYIRNGKTGNLDSIQEFLAHYGV
jgi:hypothetical protein